MSDSSSVIGREIKVTGARVAGVVSCVPSKKITNEFFIDKFGNAGVNDVIKMIGVNKRHWVDAETTTRDLCRAAGKRLLHDLNWEAQSIDALIFVSQTPDYRLPATACALQNDLALSQACIAFDINLGCSGYPYALWLGMTMVQSGAARRVLLAVGDTISKVIDPDDRSTALLFGDAGTMTAIEVDDAGNDSFFVLGSDGGGANNLIIPTGGFKNYALTHDARLVGKNPNCLFMDGGEIFNFTLRAVPALVSKTFEFSAITNANHDAFLFHQANLFMLKHLTKKTKLDPEKVPINIDEYGNTSCASIPLLLTTKLRNQLREKSIRIAAFGFGVGYSWSSVSMSVGPLQCIETIEL